MYVHAHLRTMEALAKFGEADALHEAILKVVPINLHEHVPSAARRQSNAYFSSSDAAFRDRYEASERYEAVRTGEVAVKGGWRVYSSGAGIFVHLVVTRFLGIRRHYGDLVLDPVLPKCLDGLRVGTVIDGKDVEVTYHVVDSTCSPKRVVLNGRDVGDLRHEPNPYKPGGAILALDGLLGSRGNRIEVWV
jgi:CRISPR-associated protein Csx3